MFIRKINYIWAINLVMFIAVVFLGIEQAGRGADISKYENKLVKISEEKRILTETIFKNGNDDSIASSSLNLGFDKPTKIVYFSSIEPVASLK